MPGGESCLNIASSASPTWAPRLPLPQQGLTTVFLPHPLCSTRFSDSQPRPPRNSSSVSRFLWLSRKGRRPSSPAVTPRETMSKRMGRLKTLRMGGGLGAGPLLLGRFFLREGPGGEGSSALLERGSPA